MKSDCFAGFSFPYPVGYGKRDRHANDKHEERLDKIPEMKAVPFMVMELCPNKLYNTAVGMQ
jgi:hypothetical protein